MAAIPLFSLSPVAPLFSGVSAAVPVIGIGIIGTVFAAKFLSDHKDEVESMMTGLFNPGRLGEGTSTSHRETKQDRSREYLEILTKKQFEELEMVMSHADQILLEVRVKDAEPDRERAHVVSLLRNAQPRTLKLYHCGSFSGEFLAPPPVLLVESPIFIGLFLHQGCDPGGSKGYVIYGTNEDGDGPPLLYILGWSKPAKGSPKVYVQAGLLPNMLKQPKVGKFDDLVKNQLIDRIIQKLNDLIEAHQCSSYDPDTGAEAEADIRSVYPGSSWAMLGAKFFRRQH